MKQNDQPADADARIWRRDWDFENLVGDLPAVDSTWIGQQLSDGIDDDEVVRRAKDYMQADVELRLSRTVAAMTASTTQHLRATRPAIMRGVRRGRRQFEARLEPIWGDGFEKLDALIHACQELSHGHLRAHAQQREDDNDFRCDVLVSLMARALVTASEIGALLRSGHGLGAIGRWRTLHEICVVAAIIADSPVEIAERFRLHAVVDDALGRVRDEALRVGDGEPSVLSIDEIAELTQTADEIVSRFEREFKNTNGWALPLFPDQKRVTFRDLHDRSERRGLRSDYRTACHAVHSDSWGTDLVHIEIHGQDAILTGATNSRIGAVGAATSRALMQAIATVVLNDDRDTNPELLGAVLAIRELAHDADEAFGEGERRLDNLVADYMAIGGDDAPRRRQMLLIARRSFELRCRRFARWLRATSGGTAIAKRREPIERPRPFD